MRPPCPMQLRPRGPHAAFRVPLPTGLRSSLPEPSRTQAASMFGAGCD
ncbi:CRISPR-associated protein Cas5 [Mesorhizobium sp. M1E.F.Ca.ET.063.01.1.1]|nr:CRISPR-associated protein Cas5 [Mesorhizobium sp. M1E.F.Ca.ET.063.01.1.1]